MQGTGRSGFTAAASTCIEEVKPSDSTAGLKDPDTVTKWGGHNKGRRLSEETKAKISASKKLQWKDKTYRTRVTTAVRQSLKGKPAWNRGMKMNDDFGAKISKARMGMTHTKATKAKISRSHKGLTHTQASKDAMGFDRKGVMLSEPHRLAIAASQRRRHAASRVLQAVEEVHRSGTEGYPDSSHVASSRFRTLSDISSSGLRGAQGSGPQTKVQMLIAYRGQLKEYRHLQEELTPWTQAFADKYGRKPTLADVERTGLSWLVGKYKCYVMMRDRLLMATPKLRSSVAAAAGDLPTGRPLPERHSRLKNPARTGARDPSSPAARMSAALEHRQAQAQFQSQSFEAPSSPAAIAAGLDSTSTTGAAVLGTSASSPDDRLAAATAAAKAAGQQEDAVVRGSASQASPQAEETGQSPLRGAALLETASTAAATVRGRLGNSHSSSNSSNGNKPTGRALPDVPANSSRRVRSAMAAALAYRQKQASDTAASSANAATAAGKSLPSMRDQKTPKKE